MHGLGPGVFAEEGGVAGCGVVVVGDFEEGGEGVDFEFALEDCVVVVGWGDRVLVSCAVDRGGDIGFCRGLEGLAVGAFEDVARLEIDHAAVEGGKGVVCG